MPHPTGVEFAFHGFAAILVSLIEFDLSKRIT